MLFLQVRAAELGEFVSNVLVPRERICSTFLIHLVEKGFGLVVFEHEDRERLLGDLKAHSVPENTHLLKSVLNLKVIIIQG